MEMPPVPESQPPKKLTKSQKEVRRKKTRAQTLRAKAKQLLGDNPIVAPAPELPVAQMIGPPPADRPDPAKRVAGRQERIARELGVALCEIADREKEALNLYEPMPLQEAFHRSHTHIRLTRGSTRSGKTLSAAAEIARAMLGVDPYQKYPSRGIVYVVGHLEEHHGRVTFPLLFREGAFKIVRDLVTRKWRAYRPWTKADKDRAAETQPAGPMIPTRYVKAIAWAKKNEGIPSIVKLTTGWEIHFFSGNAMPPRGQAIDIGWIDEEIAGQTWLPELRSRCTDRDGRIIWTAAPQSGTDQLYELSQEAARQEADPDKTVEEFVIRLADNVHISDAQKKKRAAGVTSEYERTTLIDGEFMVASQRVYPDFSVRLHGCPAFDIPADWTRYVAIDPGTQITAALFAAVPPPHDPKHGQVFVYDELYIPRCDANKFADEMTGKCAGVNFHDFVIDYRGSRSQEPGSGRTTIEQYCTALAERNVRCALRGSSFGVASDRLHAGIEAVKGWMRGPRPRLQVFTRLNESGIEQFVTTNLAWEMARYRHKKGLNGVTLDEPEQRGRVHACDALRYMIMRDPSWAPPQRAADSGDAVLKMLAKRRRASGEAVGVVFGVGRAT